MKIAIMFERLGPYHVARARGAMAYAEVLTIESAPFSYIYQWVKPEIPKGMHWVALTHSVGQNRDPVFVEQRLDEILRSYKPDAVALSGWAFATDLVALRWCRQHSIPTICMSETNPWDFKRRWLVEKVKKGVVAHFNAGLATSQSQMNYLTRLGIPRDSVFSGYNAIDNEFFRKSAHIWREKPELPEEIAGLIPKDAKGRYFLASSRFVAKKNLLRLLEAYAAFRQDRSDEPADWPLVILGDGEMREEIEAKISELGLTSHIHLPGFLQVDALPRYYGTAGAFVHASTTEQWGLVINEAMASGLPVAASTRCGATEYLIEDGVSGYSFDPFSTEQITQALQKLAAIGPASPLIDAGHSSVDRLSPDNFGKALHAASCAAIKNSPKPNLLAKAMLDLSIAYATRAKVREGS